MHKVKANNPPMANADARVTDSEKLAAEKPVSPKKKSSVIEIGSKAASAGRRSGSRRVASNS